MRPTFLLACPQRVDMANAVLEMASRTVLSKSFARYALFPDGWPDIIIDQPQELRGSHVVFLASFDTPADVFAQLAVVGALHYYGAVKITVVLPYFPVGTMDRIDTQGRIVTAKHLMRQLGSIPGIDVQLVTWDIHDEHELHYLPFDRVRPRSLSAMPLFEEQLRNLDNVTIVYPDEGAFKRFGSRFSQYPQVRCDKKRLGETRDVRIIEGDPRGRHCWLIDDLVMTGGTQAAACKALLQAGAEQVSTYFTHAVLPGEAWHNLREVGFTNIWTTDSCWITAERLRSCARFEILSLAPVIAQLLTEGDE